MKGCVSCARAAVKSRDTRALDCSRRVNALTRAQQGFRRKAARMTTSSKGMTYADAGVDIDAGNALVDRIKPAAKRTNRPGVMSGLGGSDTHKQGLEARQHLEDYVESIVEERRNNPTYLFDQDGNPVSLPEEITRNSEELNTLRTERVKQQQQQQEMMQMQSIAAAAKDGAQAVGALSGL